MTKTTIAKQYRSQYGTDKPTLALARIMYKDNNLLFTNVEEARTTLRYIEGKIGAKNKKKVLDKSFFIEGERPRNPYNLPMSEEATNPPCIISGHKKLGILSDIHVPYHSIDALTLAIKYLKDEKIDGLLLNGDTIDCHRLSRYTKDPKKRNFALELDTFKALFEVLKKELDCKIYFKLGNHEIRYQNFLYEKAGELIGIEEFDFENIIKARAEGIQVVGDKTMMKINSLNGIHGHEYFGITSPVNIARGLYVKGKVDAFQGHNHQTSTHSEPDMNGNVTTTYSIGCLSELCPDYMPYNRWNHGCALVELDSNGIDYEFQNKRIYKGKVL